MGALRINVPNYRKSHACDGWPQYHGERRLLYAAAAEILCDQLARDQNLNERGECIAIAGEKPAYGKVISEKNSGSILGAHLFGPGADEHIHVFAMAMRYGITRERLGEMIYVYPALGSALLYLTPGTGRMD